MSITVDWKTNVVARIVFVVAAVILLLFSVFSSPNRHGDGHEYSVITQAFLNHFSPDIRVEDVDEREQQLRAFPSQGYSQEIFGRYKRAISEGAEMYDGAYRTENGQYYGYHFWVYPAYVAGVEAIANSLGSNPLAGFQIANAILFIAVAGYCLLVVRTSLKRKIALISAFSLGGALFYLKWTHPEFFIASFLFLGFVALFQRWFHVAFPCLALAAIQVISIWTVFAAIPLLILLQYRAAFVDKIKLLSQRWWAWLCVVLPGCSLIFYYVNYGEMSLIGTGFTDINMISFSHLYSFWFDLDQGVFVGVPWLLPVLFVFLFRIKQVPKECTLDLLVAIFGSLCICVPLLMHTRVNAGQSVFQRYALYAVSPLTAWAGFYFIDIIEKKWAQFLILISAASYASAFSGPNADEDFFEHKPWTKIFLEKFPDYYNPEPGVFYARTASPNISEWGIDSGRAVVYMNREGVIRKILFPISKAEKAISNLCSGRLIDSNGTPINYKMGTHQAYGWSYLNGHIFCDGVYLPPAINLNPRYDATLFSGIDFKREGFPLFIEFAGGFSEYEGWGRWSDGPVAVLKLKGILPKHFELNLHVGAFASNIGKPVKVTIAGVTKEFVVDSKEPKEYSVQFVLPKEVTDAFIQIRPANPISPKNLGMSADDIRLLGLSFYKVALKF